MESEKKPLPTFKMTKIPLGDFAPHGELFLRGLTVAAYRNLSKADENRDLPPRELVNLIVSALVRASDDTSLSAEDVDALSADARRSIVRSIIEANRRWFVEDRNEKGKGTDLAKLCVPMEQSEEETDDEFLARGIRAELAAKRERLTGMISGLSDHMQGVIGQGLADNVGASRSLSHLLDSMRPEPAPFKMPYIPRNPIHDTNEILGQVASQIAQMRDLATATAEMQRTLNETASAAVAEFSVGAEKSFTAAEKGLKVARATLGATLLATFASVVAVGISIRSLNDQDASAELHQAALRSQTELVQTISSLREEVEEMRADASAKEVAAAKARGTSQKPISKHSPITPSPSASP